MISIVIPIYRVEEYLAATLDSLLAQTEQDWECILVDDGSPDRSGEVAEAYAAKDCRFRVIHQENAGVSAARNRGIEAARGEFLAFVDGDDCVAPDFLAQMRHAACEGIDLVFCEYRRISPEGRELYNSRYREKLASLVGTADPDEVCKFGGEDAVLASLWSCGMLSNSCCKLFRSELIERLGLRFPVGVSYAEDSLFAATYAIACRGIAFVQAVLYDYLWRDGSLSSGWWEGMLTHRSRSLTEIAALFENSGLPQTAQAAKTMRDSLNPEFLLQRMGDKSQWLPLLREYCALENYPQMLRVIASTRSLLTTVVYGLRSPRILTVYLRFVLSRR